MLLCPWNSPGKNTGVGSHSFLQSIFPTQGSNPGLPHCRWILYHLSHQQSPRRLEWTAHPFSRGSSQPRNQTGVSYITGRFFTSWATGITLVKIHHLHEPFICKEKDQDTWTCRAALALELHILWTEENETDSSSVTQPFKIYALLFLMLKIHLWSSLIFRYLNKHGGYKYIKEMMHPLGRKIESLQQKHIFSCVHFDEVTLPLL